MFILLGILYIFHLKREIRRIIEWIEHNEHIYSVNVFDKDIENLALSINKRIKEDERKEHQLKKQDKNFKKMVANFYRGLRPEDVEEDGRLHVDEKYFMLVQVMLMQEMYRRRCRHYRCRRWY